MKLIFLDIDGVLNHENTKVVAPSGSLGIEDECISRLARIVSETEAKIILTSDWKIGWESFPECCSEDANYLNRMLQKHGLKIHAKTYDEHVYDRFFEDRGRGIHRFLETQMNVTGYVVLDDHVFADFDKEIKEHLVLTDYRVGLTDSDVEKSIDLLNGKVKSKILQNIRFGDLDK